LFGVAIGQRKQRGLARSSQELSAPHALSAPDCGDERARRGLARLPPAVKPRGWT
jgi:hypothetical protein